jgi:prepilin-type N-terminal cleavage/methylation domain-containing protein
MGAEGGLTLVEMLVALLLLGVILSASAMALINFTQTTHTNERRVQATAIMNALHEEWQGIPWRHATLYDDELHDLAALGDEYSVDLSTDPAQFEGRDIVARAAPDNTACPSYDEECERIDAVPRAYDETTIDGHEYRIYQIVTWVDRSGDGVADLKRLSTIVRWDVLNREVEERFDSERAASPDEAGDPTRPRVVQFQAGPSPMQLVDDGDQEDRNSKPITIAVRFSEGVHHASVFFEEVHETPTAASGSLKTEEVELELAGTVADPNDGARDLFFTGEVEQYAHRFPNGAMTFRVEGSVDGVDEVYTGSTTVVFWGGRWNQGHGADEPMEDPDAPLHEDGTGELEPPDEPVSIENVNVNRSRVCLDDDGRLRESLTISSKVKGLTEDDHLVTATYTADGRTQADSLVGPETFPSPELGTDLSITLPEGTRRFADGDRTRFSIVANRPFSDGDKDGPVVTGVVAFDGPGSHGC